MSNKPVIVFEGIEGSGKSYHLDNVSRYLKKKGLDYIKIREPGGNLKGYWFDEVVTVWVVEILTTDGINFSARSAKDSGTAFAIEKKPKLKINETKNIFFINLI